MPGWAPFSQPAWPKTVGISLPLAAYVMSSELPAGPVLYGNQGSGAVTFTTVYDRPPFSSPLLWALSLSSFPFSSSSLSFSLPLSLSLFHSLLFPIGFLSCCISSQENRQYLPVKKNKNKKYSSTTSTHDILRHAHTRYHYAKGSLHDDCFLVALSPGPSFSFTQYSLSNPNQLLPLFCTRFRWSRDRLFGI